MLDAERREIASQVVDDDGDGTIDAIIFQGDFAAKEARHFTIEAAAPTQRYEPKVAVRHDDPRDDIAWESDRAAFRIYGEGLKKTPQAMSSSGIDVWNKKTRALIVEKWYTKKESYHIDTGEGADFYDVGETLGNGGTAGWAKDTIWRADNFKAWRVIASGPIRAIFELRVRSVECRRHAGLRDQAHRHRCRRQSLQGNEHLQHTEGRRDSVRDRHGEASRHGRHHEQQQRVGLAHWLGPGRAEQRWSRRVGHGRAAPIQLAGRIGKKRSVTTWP